LILFFRLKFDAAGELLDKFFDIAKNSDGKITYDQFAKYLRLPKSDALEEVFSLYDRVSYKTCLFFMKFTF
jgi:Ca2+-binding EF-hand superfamily protein